MSRSSPMRAPERRLSELPILTEAERQRIVVEWNDTRRDYPKDKCIHHLFEAQVERTPDAAAVVSDGKELSYRELNARANRLAHHLRKCGVGPEVLVGLCVDRSLEMIVGLVGILKAGGAYVPLDPIYPRERLGFMLEDARISVLVTERRLREELGREGMRIISLDDESKAIGAESEENPPQRTAADHLAYVIYTSGSTGKPKGVLITHKNLVHSTSARFSYYSEPVASFLLIPSLAFDSSVAGIFWTLCQGGTLVLLEQGASYDAPQVAALIGARGITHLLCLPSLYALLLAHARPEQLVSLKTAIVAGEACPSELAERHRELLPKTFLFNEYGPTEATVWSSVYPCAAEEKGPRVPIGGPIANVRMYILDRRMQPVSPGVEGELHIGGAGLGRGYLDRADLTAEKFIPDPFGAEPGARLYKTGDLARYLPQGHIEFLGRMDQQVKIRGFRIELGEIESTLAQHPGVKESVVIVREDARGGEQLAGYVVPSQQPTPTVSALREFLQQKLPEHMIPSQFVFLASLPLTPNGKIDRRALPVPPTTRPELESAFVPPRTDVEKVLAGIWAHVLRLAPVGVHDNFFELGGHSLLATQALSRIHDCLGVDFSLQGFFDAPTIEALGAAILKFSNERARIERTALLLLELAQLSEDQVETMLEEKTSSSPAGSK